MCRWTDYSFFILWSDSPMVLPVCMSRQSYIQISWPILNRTPFVMSKRSGARICDQLINHQTLDVYLILVYAPFHYHLCLSPSPFIAPLLFPPFVQISSVIYLSFDETILNFFILFQIRNWCRKKWKGECWKSSVCSVYKVKKKFKRIIF